jgi:hypothetical protein
MHRQGEFMSARPSYCTLGKVRELVDWDDVQIEHVFSSPASTMAFAS